MLILLQGGIIISEAITALPEDPVPKFQFEEAIGEGTSRWPFVLHMKKDV